MAGFEAVHNLIDDVGGRAWMGTRIGSRRNLESEKSSSNDLAVDFVRLNTPSKSSPKNLITKNINYQPAFRGRNTAA